MLDPDVSVPDNNQLIPEKDQCVSGEPGNSDEVRKDNAFTRRQEAANIACNRDINPSENQANGDENDFRFLPGLPGTPTSSDSGEGDATQPRPDDRSFIANYTKGMSHNALGEVAPRSDYRELLDAVEPPNEPMFPPQPPEEFEEIPRGPGRLSPIPPPPDPAEALRRYVDPQAGIAFSLMAPDPPQAAVVERGSFLREPFPAAPEFSSKEAAAEMGEVYAMSLLREVPFNRYNPNRANQAVQQAVATLNEFEDFRGPKDENGQVSAQTLFRGGNYFRDPDLQISGGELKGPYLSQFLIIGTAIDQGRGPTSQFSPGQPGARTGRQQEVIPPGSSTGLSVSRRDGMVQYGAVTINQRQREIEPGLDFMTDYEEWLRIQHGFEPRDRNVFTGERKFIFNGRAMGNFVHFDQTYQTYYIAALLLLGMEGRANDLGVPLFSEGNPYNAPDPSMPNLPSSMNQEGFGTFGNGHLLALLGEADRRAIEAVWYQKWNVHRRLRPETFSGRVHNTVRGTGNLPQALPGPEISAVSESRYEIDDDLINSAHGRALLRRVFDRNAELNGKEGRPGGGTYLLNQVFPEGSPMHPSYGAGHATEAGAGITILKAFFNEDLPVTDPLVGFDNPDVTQQVALEPNDDGTALREYEGPDQNEERLVWEELNKLAANVSLGRNFAGVHYRTDYTASVRLGEYIAVTLLMEQAENFNPEQFFQLTLFDRRIVQIRSNGRVVTVGQRE